MDWQFIWWQPFAWIYETRAIEAALIFFERFDSMQRTLKTVPGIVHVSKCALVPWVPQHFHRWERARTRWDENCLLLLGLLRPAPLQVVRSWSSKLVIYPIQTLTDPRYRIFQSWTHRSSDLSFERWTVQPAIPEPRSKRSSLTSAWCRL